MDLWAPEREQWNLGRVVLCGVDEAGAGPLAGPVYAAAVILPRELDIPGLDDSKKLTEKKREALFGVITAQAEAWSVAWAEPEEIDEMDILNARMLAMQRAIDGLRVRPDLCLIDGNRDHGSRVAVAAPHITLVGGDGKSASIAAASILAKVSRDRYVSRELEARYPQYGFAKHKGYGTKLHYEALDRYGPCPAHRRTFLKKWEARRAKISGDQGEERAAQYLERQGYAVLDRQWRCRFGELDVVARSPEGVLCFVEVKRRGRGAIGLPREFVDGRKRERLRKAASAYLGDHDPDARARFDVAEIYEEAGGTLRVVYLENAFE